MSRNMAQKTMAASLKRNGQLKNGCEKSMADFFKRRPLNGEPIH